MSMRTYSDPDLPNLISLQQRPASSYEPRPKAQEYSSFDTSVVEEMGKKLGLEVVSKEKEFRWVPRDCLLSLQQEGWSVRCAAQGGLEFCHVPSDGEWVKTSHPIMDAHRLLADRLRDEKKGLKIKRENPHFCVRELVYRSIMGEKDVRLVTTPRLIEDIMELLDVNAHDEPYLILRVKVSVEDCYFRMKKIGRGNITIENCIDVESLMVNLELDRVGFMKKISPIDLLYCVECQTQLADVISAGSHDVFCNGCAAEIHSAGQRQDVPLVFFEQAVCSECCVKGAMVRCQDCVDNFCYECFQTAHKYGKRQKHCVSLACRTFCSECDENEAAYMVVETEDVLCTKCTARMHRSGARQNHTLLGLRKAAYSKKLFASNLDRLMFVLTKYVERQYGLSPWFVFYNRALAPFWYNFESHHNVLADPNDLINPPIEEEEGGEAVGGLSADAQMSRPLPGATRLHDTHAAKFASKAACFEVPPPMYVKFSSSTN